MTKYEFGDRSGEELVSPGTKNEIYSSLDAILEQAGVDEEGVFLTASAGVDKPAMTSGPENSLPVIQIRRPYAGPARAHNFDYEIVYGFQDAESALRIQFLGDAIPVVQGVRTGPLKPKDEIDSLVIEIGWPIGDLCERDAQNLLADLRNIKSSSDIGGENGADS
jgi:hypothetical protein